MADKVETTHKKLQQGDTDRGSIGPAVVHSSAKRMKPARFVPTPAGYTHVVHYKDGDLVASHFWLGGGTIVEKHSPRVLSEAEIKAEQDLMCKEAGISFD